MGEITLIAPLSNTNCANNINLPGNLAIESIPEHLDTKIKKAIETGLIRHVSEYSHCLVARKIDSNISDSLILRNKIEDAIIKLRLFKAGGPGFNIIFKDENNWYDAPTDENSLVEATAIFFYSVWKRKGLTLQYTIEQTEESSLAKLFEKTKKSSLMDKPSFRYFFRAYHEPYGTDRFLSYVIALENVLVNEQKDHTNIRYKFADRGCFLLSKATNSSIKPEDSVKILKKIYDYRSSMVHANRTKKSDMGDDNEVFLLQKSEEYLRILLNYIIDNPDMEDSNKVDIEKRKSYITF